MKTKRLVIVTKRFWPLTGPTETSACYLASALHRLGHQVEVVTVAWQKNWPSRFLFREFDVRRITKPSVGPFGSFRHIRALVRELQQISPDGVIMYGLGEEVSAVRKTLGPNVPVVIRADGRLLSERKNQKNFSLEMASAVVCDSQHTRDLLYEKNVRLPEHVVVLPDGVEFPDTPPRTPVGQSSSRLSISDAHPILRIEPDQPLVITGAPLDRDYGLLDLVQAWKCVVETYPQAKLWVVGDGPKGRLVWEAIVEAELVYSVIMPGFFDDHEELIRAADLYVHATRRPCNCGFLFEAIAKGLCVVATEKSLEGLRDLKFTDSATNHGSNVVLQHQVNGILASRENPKDIADAILMGLSDRALRLRVGNQAKTDFRSAIDIDRLVGEYVNVMTMEPSPKSKTPAEAGLS